MNVSTAIKNRRAVKQFDPTHQMSEEEIKRLLSLAMESPTAFNLQHWRFLLVRNPAIRETLKTIAWNQPQVTDASLLIILCANLAAWENPQPHWKNTSQEVQNFIFPAIKAYYEGKPQVIRDECMRSCGLVGQTIMLAAQEMGLDSCPMDGFDFEAAGTLINLPNNHVISFMIAIGKKVAEPHSKPGQLEYDTVVKIDSF